jgi:hypothetical protein
METQSPLDPVIRRSEPSNHEAGKIVLVPSAPPLSAFAPTARLSMTPSARVRTPIPNMCATRSGIGTNRTF